jgi:hypothetical protein
MPARFRQKGNGRNTDIINENKYDTHRDLKYGLEDEEICDWKQNARLIG